MAVGDTQVGGDHYKRLSVQPWDAMESWFGREGFKSYLLMNAVKYLAREKADKVEDVKKARHYLDKWLELSA